MQHFSVWYGKSLAAISEAMALLLSRASDVGSSIGFPLMATATPLLMAFPYWKLSIKDFSLVSIFEAGIYGMQFYRQIPRIDSQGPSYDLHTQLT